MKEGSFQEIGEIMKVMLKVMVATTAFVGVGSVESKKQVKEEIEHPLHIHPGKVKIINVAHHKGPLSDRITLRFDAPPLFNLLPLSPVEAEDHRFEDVEEFHFFLPQTVLKGESTKKFVSHMNASMHPAFHVSLERVDTPLEGLRCSVRFNPKKVGFQVESGTSPKLEPSITFTFYDRNVLQVINNNHNSILRTAHLDGVGRFLKKKYA